jgi:hypothetical protein
MDLDCRSDDFMGQLVLVHFAPRCIEKATS